MSREVLVIGAGIHGVTVAIELAKKGNNVTIVDAKSEILDGTSSATHNRVHLGYHYPRSKETAIECIQGYHHFLREYKDSLLFPDFYYAVEKNSSNVNAQQYSDAMKDVGLDCNSSWPDERFLNRDNIEDCFKVKEACFDVWSLKRGFKKKLKELGIKTIFDFRITGSAFENDKVKLFSSSPSTDGYPDNPSLIELKTDLIINCTYTYTNNIQKIFSIDCDSKPYKFESTEVAVVESEIKIPALTVMDGPFVTILPYAGKDNHYLVYDKINSVVEEEVGTEYTPPVKENNNWDKMLEHGLKYYPFFDSIKYKYSLYGSRPISVSEVDDGRATKIVRHDYPIDFYSILEGKFVSAPLIAKTFAETIERREASKKSTALIGYTGFIGSNLNNDYLFTDRYNTKNIKDVEGKEYDLVISCANSSLRWRVNQNPEGDLENIKTFATSMSKVKAKNLF